MKKLGKITINPEKVIKNEELINLRGGYEGLATIYCWNGDEYLGCVQTPYCPTDPVTLCDNGATWATCIEGGSCM